MPEAIRVVHSPGGGLTYAVALPPERLPAVQPNALVAAWDIAREAAAAQAWGPAREILFRRNDGEATRIAIADPDASCWAEAVDRVADLSTLPGLALCLRLLALIEVMGRANFLSGLFDVTATGVEFHPALLRTAASMPLDSGARFDAEALRRLLSRALPAGALA
jgi:hypothetical protein